MNIEFAKLSLIGKRKDNQDRAEIAIGEEAALLMVFDGMGGHSDGAIAAETALAAVQRVFDSTPQPVFDVQGFLYRAVSIAHDAVVALGKDRDVDSRPRATCAICLVQDDACYWVHVGDSRIYLLRDHEIHHVTRDHSHVEVLIHEGVISRAEAQEHPMRNYVESCLGGDDALPGITVSRKRDLMPGDVLLLCSDGLWSGLPDETLIQLSYETEMPLPMVLKVMCDLAIKNNGKRADNTTVAALRWVD
ncbi:MAG: PP2C family serine/threonine-protein phosphatase [Pseudomonadota bacterium]